MSEYRMLPGLLLFMVVVIGSLWMAGDSFPELRPSGADELGDLFPTEPAQPPRALQQTEEPDTTVACTSWTELCWWNPLKFFQGQIDALEDFYNWVVGGINIVWDAMSTLFSLFISVITFDIPAIRGVHPVLDLFRYGIVTVIIVTISLFIFNKVRSLIPFLGGE